MSKNPQSVIIYICVENNVDVHQIRQISLSEAHMKAFHFVFNFDEEKIAFPDFWPENFTVSRFYLKEAACDWLKKVDQKLLLAIPPLKQ